MKTKAVRLYGENDLRLEEFELPAIKDDEILVKIVSDSLCMSSYKAAVQYIFIFLFVSSASDNASDIAATCNWLLNI